MKWIVAGVVMALSACAGVPEDAHTLWLVRHAEKMAGDDPALTEAGQARAVALADRLEVEGVERVLSTDTRRTRDTAAPLAERAGLEVELYDARDLAGLAERLKRSGADAAVVGHSNTTPQLAEALGCGPQEPIVEADEYDRLYRIRVGEGVDCRIERYGE